MVDGIADKTIKDVVDFPTIGRNSSGSICVFRRPRAGGEARWCAELATTYDRWRDVVDMKPATKIEIERPLTFHEKARPVGICRADIIVWHGKSECSIIETKTDCSATAVAAGIGQLIYYRALAISYWNVKVDALLLAAPELPPFVLEAIAGVSAPIRFLKRDSENNLSGLVPRYA